MRLQRLLVVIYFETAPASGGVHSIPSRLKRDSSQTPRQNTAELGQMRAIRAPGKTETNAVAQPYLEPGGSREA